MQRNRLFCRTAIYMQSFSRMISKAKLFILLGTQDRVFIYIGYHGQKIYLQFEDPRKRAIIASAYPFLRQFPSYTDFFEVWNFKSLNDFALHDVQGKTNFDGILVLWRYSLGRPGPWPQGYLVWGPPYEKGCYKP